MSISSFWSVSQKMIPCSRPKLADFFTLSQTKQLENHSLHSTAYLHGPYLVVPLPPQVPSTPLPTPTGLLICYGWAKVLFFISHVWLTHALPTNELGHNYFCWNVYPSFAPPFNFLHPLGFQCMRTRSTFKRSTCTCFCTSFGFDNLRQLFE